MGVTEADGIHKPSGLTFVYLHHIHHAGFVNGVAYIPARPVSEVSMLTYKGWKIINKSLDKYFSNLSKRSSPDVAEVFKPLTKDLLNYTRYNVFGNTDLLEENAPSVIDRKGFNEPMVETGTLLKEWKVRINGTVVN